MSYYFNKKLNLSFDKAMAGVTEELKKEGFGILTDIDVKATLKKKLDVEFRKYRILGAWNPSFAYSSENKKHFMTIFMVVSASLCFLPRKLKKPIFHPEPMPDNDGCRLAQNISLSRPWLRCGANPSQNLSP